jgi:Chemoreceptor zinc-binding domain
MDLDEAIKKHSEWKTKFRAAIVKKEKLDAEAICTDDKCDLGKWLHGPAKSQLKASANYQACVKKHAEFHKEAGKVAKLINGEKFTDAETALGGTTSYGAASNSVIMAIQALKRELG